MNARNSRIAYQADGTTKRYAVPFTYIRQTHVHVFVDQTRKTQTVDYFWHTASTIEFKTPPVAGSRIVFVRQTEVDKSLVEFQNGATLTEEELNLAVRQLLYLHQEVREQFDAIVEDGVPGQAATIIDGVIQDVLNSSLLAALQEQIGDITLNAQSILDQTIRLDSFRGDMDGLIADLDDVDARIISESQARIDGDAALATQLSVVVAKSDDNAALIAQESTARADADEALATQINLVQANVDDNTASIATETAARVTADEALAQQITLLQAELDEAEALIAQVQVAFADETQALAQQITGLQSEFEDNRATFLQEIETLSTAQGSTASAVQTLQSAVDGNTASIQQQAQVIDGLEAEWTLKLDVNGYVSGIGLANDGQTSDFMVLADRFSIVTPGTNPVVPFVATAQGVFIKDAFIQNLTVDKITSGSLTADVKPTTGKIVLETATHMKVIGNGFGAQGNLLEWFGPRMAVGQCSTSNGITYVTTNGNAYFGGSLTAGTLYNARTSTDTVVPSEVVLGPYGTNGNPKVIVASYNFLLQGVRNGNQLGNRSGSFSARVRLYRRVGTGGESLIQTETFSGGWISETYLAEGFNQTSFEGGVSGSFTITDNLASTASRTYRLLVDLRTEGSYGGTSPQLDQRSQTLTLTSTEE
ncbi:MAG: phage tail fiber domain-containing protein [Lysobacteraceae bacterium]